MFHETCYPTQVEALTAACTAVATFGADGSRATCSSVQMTAPTPSTTAGGTFPGKLNVVKYGPDGTSLGTLTPSVTVQACERYDFDYWSPLVSAWVAALVAVIAARILYVRLFQRETL